MNKIERAIYDTKLHLKDCKERIMLALKEKETLKNQLETLEFIESNKDIPHEVKPKENAKKD